jgi:hypothetical protein
MIIGIIGLITFLGLGNMLFYELRVKKFEKDQDIMKAYLQRRFNKKYGSKSN